MSAARAAMSAAAAPPPASSSSALSLGLLPLPAPPEQAIARVRLADIVPYEGSPSAAYASAVDALSGSLMRRNAALIELGGEEAVAVRCALESARVFLRTRPQCGTSNGWGKSSRGVYTYRAGRPLEDGDVSPPCMGDAFRCLGKAARAALCAIARHLRLRCEYEKQCHHLQENCFFLCNSYKKIAFGSVFNHLLDDNPLPVNEVSSSVLTAAYSHTSFHAGKMSFPGGKLATHEVEKGLLTLIASDFPGIQVCDPNGRWYLADGGLGPGDILLLTGRALSHATAGLRPAASYRAAAVDGCSGIIPGGRASLSFRLMPHSNAILDCSPIAAAGHIIPQSYQPISVSQFMDDLSTEEDVMCNHVDNNHEVLGNLVREPSLRSILSDPLSGTFLEDAVVVSCGHSFGGHMLKKVLEMARCSLCSAEIVMGSLIPNLALRAAATAIKNEDERRLFHNSTLRKRRKDVGEHFDTLKRSGKENGEISGDGDSSRQHKGVQYPFAVCERVLIKGNRRTPDKFVGREAVITSQCLNGWYLLKILDSGESVRLQYRSLQKLSTSHQADDRIQPQPLLQSSSN